MPPDCCDYNGLTAPYPNSFGEMTMYKDGIRYEEDDDFEEFIICENEEMFKETVIKLLGNYILIYTNYVKTLHYICILCKKLLY